MELNTIPDPEVVQKAGNQMIALVAGDKLKIQTKLKAGGGDEVLEYTVPVGRTSDASISVFINERSA